MKDLKLIENLGVPEHRIDAVLDTDTYNEIDDQFALAYMINSEDRINLKAIYAAPFYNEKSSSPGDGMCRSYEEIMRILELSKREDLKQVTFHGSICRMRAARWSRMQCMI